MAALGSDSGFGRQPLSNIARRIQTQKGYVTAAINADYFSMTATNASGDPLGIHIQDGELVSLPAFNRSALIGLRDGRVLIARLQVNAFMQLPNGRTVPLSGLNEPPLKSGWCLFTPTFGPTTQMPTGMVEIIAQGNLPLRPNTPLTATVRAISTAGNATIPQDGVVLVATGDAIAIAQTLVPDTQLQLLINLTPLDASFDPRDIVWAIGGGPRLLRNGQISVEYAVENFSAKLAETKHPRTAVGLKNDSLLFVVVDGRQPGYSEGMTLFELAEFLRNAGCTDALNLDGGGSTTLWVRGEVVNRPSDGRERPIANALLLLNLFPPQPIVRLLVKTTEGHFLVGTPVPFAVFGEDAAYRLIPLKPEEVTVTTRPPCEIRWDGSTLLLPTLNGDRPQPLRITVAPKEGGAASTTVSFRVHPKPDELRVTPDVLLVAPGGSVRLTVQAFGREPSGEKVPLQFDPSAVRWVVHGNIGSVQDNVFWAAPQTGEGILEAILNGVNVRIPVRVGNIAEGNRQTLHELDDLSGITVQVTPPTVRGEVAITTTNKRSGTGALQLRYDFSQGKRLRAVYLVLNKPLPSGAKWLAVWVYGDGNECWLRARLRDGTGKPIFMDIVPILNWRGEWREVQVPLPLGLTEPITLEAIYLAAIRDDHQPQGVILLDSLRVGF